MKRFVVILLSVSVLLSGCVTFTKGAEQAKLEQATDLPVICKARPDCDKKWQRASEWVTLHAVYDIPVQTDTMIQTRQPKGLDDRAGFTVSKVHDNDDIYAIQFKVTCNDWFGCRPSTTESKADFVYYLNESAENSKTRLGLMVHPISSTEAQADGIQGTTGVVSVVNVARKSVAEKAGIHSGDIIINYDGHPVTTQDELDQWVAQTPHEQLVILLVLRGKETHPVKVRL